MSLTQVVAGGFPGLSVGEALKIEALAQVRVLAGKQGLDRVIRTVTVMDTPDIKDWLKGGELLLTNVFVIKDDPAAQVALVRDLNDRGVAALGVKLKRWIQDLPAGMLDLASELGLPILEMPVDCAWIDVLIPVLTEILNRQAARLEESRRIHGEFTRIALSGAGIADICGGLATVAKSPTAFFDRLGTLQVYATPAGLSGGPELRGGLPAATPALPEGPPTEAPLDWKALFATVVDTAAVRAGQVASVRRNGQDVMVGPLTAGADSYGHLLMVPTAGVSRDTATMALEHAGTVATLEMVKRRAVQETERRFRNDFLIDLLSGHIESREAVLSRARSVGDWDFTRPHAVLVLDLDHFEQFYLRHHQMGDRKPNRAKEDFQETVAAAVRAASPTAVTIGQSDSMTVLLPVREGVTAGQAIREHLRVFATSLKAQVRARLKEVTASVGIGRLYVDVMEWPLAYREARLALLYGRRIWGRDRVIHYDDLGTYRILLHHGDSDELKAFADDVLRRLDACESSHREGLYQTLVQYFRCGRRVRETAEALFVHVNTVRHRLARIRELVGFDPGNPEDCLNLEMALRIRSYLAGEDGQSVRSPGPL